MLVSELQERARKFKLALKVGIPILILVLILFASVISDKELYSISGSYFMLALAIIIVIIYFIYTQVSNDSKETLLDRNTQAYNITAFKKNIQKANIKSMGMLTIDNLIQINGRYGVEKTDTLLQNLVQRLDDYAEIEGMSKNVIGRYSGSEFLISSASDSKHLETTLAGFIDENPAVNNIQVVYRFSVTSISNLDFNKAIAVLKTTIKTKASNIVKNPQKEVQTKEEEKLHMDHVVIDALRDKSLNFYFKPITNLQTGTIEIFKVGVKMFHANKEILPKIYLPIIGRLGHGREYDYLVLEYLSLFLLLVDDRVSFSFNLSANSIRDKEFRDKIADLMANNVNASRLIIEQYERKHYPDLEEYVESLHYMHKQGFKVAIDNFGSTNSSVENMRYFDFDFVEFDSSYIKKIDNEATNSMFKSLIGVSKALGAKSIAKWVDNESQKEILRKLDVDYAQGFGVGEPISENELLALYGQ